MRTISVKFPTGTRDIPAITFGRGKLGAAPVGAVPRCVPGFKLTRTPAGWSAEKVQVSV